MCVCVIVFVFERLCSMFVYVTKNPLSAKMCVYVYIDDSP